MIALVDKSNATPLGRLVRDVLTPDHDAAGGNRRESGHSLEQRGLARTARADHESVAPERNFQADVSEPKVPYAEAHPV
jgi:hypothetical protein